MLFVLLLIYGFNENVAVLVKTNSLNFVNSFHLPSRSFSSINNLAKTTKLNVNFGMKKKNPTLLNISARSLNNEEENLISKVIDKNATQQTIFDPCCDPDKPVKINSEDIANAASAIQEGIIRTPDVKAEELSSMYSTQIFLKQEYMQATGSFKERGARYALKQLNDIQKKKGVVAASAGNHALGLAYHGSKLGIPVKVVIPKIAASVKINRCKKYGANADLQQSILHAHELANKQKLKYINGFDNPDVIAGQGTIGLEILEQVPSVDAVIVPVGGGGLIAGIAVTIKSQNPNVRVIESEKYPTLKRAIDENNSIPITKAGPTLADGIAVQAAGFNAVSMARDLIDDLIVVSEDNVALAVLRLLEVQKTVLECAGAIGLALFISGQLDYLRGKSAVIVFSGANIDTTQIVRTIERGLVLDGRLTNFLIAIPDRPGEMSKLSEEIGRFGANIREMYQERSCFAPNMFMVRVRLVCETSGAEHGIQIFDHLRYIYGNDNVHLTK